jgi:hypothetical protein
MCARKLWVVVGVFLLASTSAAAYGANAQSSSKESPQSSGKTAEEKAAEAQSPERDANSFQLTGTALHQDGSAWEGLQIMLLFVKKGKSEAIYAFDAEGQSQLTNPHAKTDAKGRFAINVHRGYLKEDAEETEFRVGYFQPVPLGSISHLIEMRKKGSKGSLTLRIKKNVDAVDTGEVW